MRVFLLGVPMNTGGGSVEAGTTALLWRSLGHDVTAMWPARCVCGQIRDMPENNPWIPILAEKQIDIVKYTSGRLNDVPGLAGSLVVDFCCQHLSHNCIELNKIGCRLIHSPCMNFVLVNDNICAFSPPSAIHYQSKFQYSQISDQWKTWGVKEHVVIPGAFERSLFPFNHSAYKSGDEFVVGRLARGARSKWSSQMFPMLEAVRTSGVNLHFLGMAWNDLLTNHLGDPPKWATCLPENAISSVEFLSRCHAMICPNGTDVENFPRVGLEALASGVPLLVDNRGGWPDMVGDAAILCNGPVDYANGLNRLATDESFRQSLIQRGVERVSEISDSSKIGAAWNNLFQRLA